jgi:hypothetical protein
VPVDERFLIGVERMEVEVSAAEVAELVRSARATDRSFQAARTRFRIRLAELVAARAGEQSRQPVPASVAEVVTVVRKAQAYQRLCNRVWPRVAPEQLVQSLYKTRRRLEQTGGDLLTAGELGLLLAASPPPRPIDRSATDVALLDEARWLIEPELRTF